MPIFLKTGECMRALKIINDRLIFEINRIEVPLVFNIAVAMAGERKYGSLIDSLKELGTVRGCQFYLIAMTNEAIKKYNREYNRHELPITEQDVLGLIINVNDLYTLMREIRSICYLAQPKDSGTGNGGHSDTKPTINSFIVAATSQLGLTMSNVLGLTLSDISDMLKAYMAMTGIDKKPPVDESAGVGSGEDLEKLLER